MYTVHVLAFFVIERCENSFQGTVVLIGEKVRVENVIADSVWMENNTCRWKMRRKMAEHLYQRSKRLAGHVVGFFSGHEWWLGGK